MKPMTPVEITVRGSHTVAVAPEQATVYASIAAEGPEPRPVFDAAAASLADVTRSLESHHHPKKGPVTTFVVDQVRLSSHRPFTHDGVQLPPVHTATVSITATFTDFDELAAWVGSTAAVPGLGIGYIDWALTDARRLRLERKARQKAVRDARRRAQDYADALDLGPVRVRSISDPGMGPPIQRKTVLANAVADPGGSPGVALRPDDVQIDAQVEATFVVSG